MNKLIRNIPDDVVTVLQEQAKSMGLTLEAYIRLKLIELAKQVETKRTDEEGDDAKRRA